MELWTTKSVKKLKKGMKRRNVGVAELAKAVDLSRTAIYDILRCKSSPRLRTLEMIAHELRVPPMYFFSDIYTLDDVLESALEPFHKAEIYITAEEKDIVVSELMTIFEILETKNAMQEEMKNGN